MEKDNYFLENFNSYDGKNLVIHHWPVEKPKMLIHLVHGMSEHGYRYHEFCKWLNKKGIYAYASDLRGHGKTAGSIEDIVGGAKYIMNTGKRANPTNPGTTAPSAQSSQLYSISKIS